MKPETASESEGIWARESDDCQHVRAKSYLNSPCLGHAVILRRTARRQENPLRLEFALRF
ncbi:hypothetical protein HanPSC8_Chr01g0026441 [Helianthus annuus]|nr:hypothetical protein HanPSC8_Chr01g0026441 [Helianthus annuus]